MASTPDIYSSVSGMGNQSRDAPQSARSTAQNLRARLIPKFDDLSPKGIIAALDLKWKWMIFVVFVARIMIILDMVTIIAFCIGIDLGTWYTRSYYFGAVGLSFVSYFLATYTINPWYKWMIHIAPLLAGITSILGAVSSLMCMINLADMYVKDTPAPTWPYMATLIVMFINFMVLLVQGGVCFTASLYSCFGSIKYTKPESGTHNN